MTRCQYCNQPAKLVSSREVYRKDYGPIWLCRPCGAWVGCHDGTEKPLGRLANAELRAWKIKAHAAFDPLWKKKLDSMRVRVRLDYPKHLARNAGYAWLADQLGIPRKRCHIGMFDVELCKKTVQLCQRYA